MTDTGVEWSRHGFLGSAVDDFLSMQHSLLIIRESLSPIQLQRSRDRYNNLSKTIIVQVIIISTHYH